MRTFKEKIKSPTQLRALLAKVGKRKRVIFTNGCYDILHPGHVSLLERARKKGDLLVVALNTDRSVSKMKGPTRPVNCLSDRQQIIAALECVDFVTFFDEPTPLEIIKKLKPWGLVKGGDWKIAQIVGASEVRSWGGKVFSLPLIKGKSTTGVIQKILTL